MATLRHKWRLIGIMEVVKKHGGIQVYLCGEYHWLSKKASIELRDKLDALLGADE